MSVGRTPAPNAAARPSSIIKTLPIPASSAALSRARCSTCVTSETMLITAWSDIFEPPVFAFFTKWASIFLVRSKSPTTPPVSGAFTITSRPSRPVISAASWPKATISSVISLIATSDGSSSTTPRPLTAMIVLGRAEVDRHRIGNQFF